MEKFINFDFGILWEQRRYEISKAMLAAFMSNSCSNVHGGSVECKVREAVQNN